MRRRELRFDDFDAALAEVEQIARLPHVRAGRWDLARVCTHLGDGLEATVNGFPARPAPWLVRRLVAPLALRWVFRTGRMPAGVPIPGDSPPDPRGADAAACAARLRSAIRAFTDHPGDYHPHPFFGPMRRDAWRRWHLIHMAHHLGFLVPEPSARK